MSKLSGDEVSFRLRKTIEFRYQYFHHLQMTQSVYYSQFERLLHRRLPVLQQRDWCGGFVQQRVDEETPIGSHIVLSS